jgi:hypothetical protein
LETISKETVLNIGNLLSGETSGVMIVLALSEPVALFRVNVLLDGSTSDVYLDE